MYSLLKMKFEIGWRTENVSNYHPTSTKNYDLFVFKYFMTSFLFFFFITYLCQTTGKATAKASENWPVKTMSSF